MILAGHEDAWRAWREALAGERLHHAWLLAGKRGLGKMHFAIDAARMLVAEPGVPQPSGPHPDIVVVSHLAKDEKDEAKRLEGQEVELARNLKISQVRDLQRRLTTRPTLGRRRAVLIDPIDDMEASAANALLKSLEEPPAGTIFLLVSHNPARLLPTIRSRCRLLRFSPLDDATVERIVTNEAPQTDPAKRSAAVIAGAGSPGAALAFLAQDLGAAAAVMRELAENGDADFARRGRLADAVGARPDRARIAAVLDLARAVVAERLPGANRSAYPALHATHADLVRLGSQAQTYNFDPGLLVMQVGGLLASLGAASSHADA